MIPKEVLNNLNIQNNDDFLEKTTSTIQMAIVSVMRSVLISWQNVQSKL